MSPPPDDAPFQVISSFPGRMRVQLAARFRAGPWLARAAEQAAAVPCVAEVSEIDDAASVVVRYDPRLHPEVQALSDVVSALGRLFAAATGGTGQAPELMHASVLGETRLATGGVSSQTPTAKAQAGGPRVSVAHSLPGRLRLHVPSLRRRRDVVTHVETILGRRNGIHSVQAVPDAGSVVIRYDPAVHPPRRLVRFVERLVAYAITRPASGETVQRLRDVPATPANPLAPLVVPTAALALAATRLLPPIGTAAAVAAAALPIARRATSAARHRRWSVDQLDLSALIVLLALGDPVTAALMTWLVGLGELIRDRTMRRSRRAIGRMLAPERQQAWVERGGTVVSVPVSALTAGDTVLVYPGDQIPVDGEVISGRALVDQRTLTGESMPLARQAGDPVLALSVISDGQIAVRVDRIGRETRAGRIVQLIEDAPLSDTRIQNYAELIGDRLVAPIFALAGGVYLLTGSAARAAAVLILDFATGLRVSAPTTMLSAMVGAARHGLLIKGGRAMEKLASVDAVVWDKTGTLTSGTPMVTAVHALGANGDPHTVLRLAASAEANLKHPAARAIAEAGVRRDVALAPPTEVHYELGAGVQARIEGRLVLVGSERFLRQAGVDTVEALEAADRHYTNGLSTVYVAVDGMLAGLIAYTDPPRPEAALAVQALAERGIKRVVMLTGDHIRVARAVAGRLGIPEVVAEAYPDQKAEVVRSLQSEGYTVAVIGDGINDSAAFSCADVGISLGHGADVAKEVADVILLDGDLRRLPLAIDLSRSALGVLRQNVNLVVGPTAAGLVGSVVGLSSPLVSTLINNGTTVLAGLNALRPLGWRQEVSAVRQSDRLPVGAEA